MIRRPDPVTVDRIVAACLVVIGQLELWIADAVPGPKWVAAPLLLVMTGAVAFRRRWPLASGSAVLLANGVQGAVAGHGNSLAQAVGWFCALYAIAVWTTRASFLIGIGVLGGRQRDRLLAGPGGLSDAGCSRWSRWSRW